MTATKSALETLIARSASIYGDVPQLKLATEVAHNLRYQHDWSDLRIHQTCQGSPLPTPMISGLPPQRLYIHPDEQVELLQEQKKAGRVGLPETSTQREWVLPTHLRDRWSLHRFSDVFDAVTVVPDTSEGVLVPFSYSKDGNTALSDEDRMNPWRTTKRLALAVLDDDSTVVFYIVHDGIVKPRQN